MENLNSAMNSLNEQSKKINIAMHYLSNDMEKSKLMVSGKLKDLIVIKGIFSSSSLYGAFILFFNYGYSMLTDCYFLVSKDYSISSIRTSQDWKTFEKEVTDFSNADNSRISYDFKEKFETGFTGALGKEITKFLKVKDTTQVIHILQRYISERSELKRTELALDFQSVSSLEMELDSMTSKKLDKKIIEKKKQDVEKKVEVPKTDENADPEVGKNGIKLIVKSTLVLSPIKGKHISNVKTGDRVMVSMVEKNNQTIQIARAFKAYDEESGNMKAVPGRVMKIEYIDTLGYKIFTIIAKGIIAEIVEEESNIKVALDPSMSLTEGTIEDDKKSNLAVPVIVGLVFAIIISIAIIMLIIG